MSIPSGKSSGGADDGIVVDGGAKHFDNSPLPEEESIAGGAVVSTFTEEIFKFLRDVGAVVVLNVPDGGSSGQMEKGHHTIVPRSFLGIAKEVAFDGKHVDIGNGEDGCRQRDELVVVKVELLQLFESSNLMRQTREPIIVEVKYTQ
jgi:hypothetical protein